MSAFHTLGAVQIARGLVWVNEFDWSTLETAAERGITGANIIDVAENIGGRPITLQGSDNAGWLSRATVIALQAMAEALDVDGEPEVYTLTLADGRVFSVIFAPGAKPIEAKPMGRPELSTEPNPYVATVRLVTVAA
ncbi:hypothetical protein KBW71_11550 [Hydrogenophaga aromaticivorans]|uniref:hypothetical protein n=1 Tax=Hydrogenophaga aromaticivorans TaxID=2610898 RepID=UPI001B3778AD|nr:hypothetical protein [Hydrogenophaga aromaticivorans]MBQ0919072.1 hypothetical protein [Hydrogenophaga aromaticivorans]